MNEATDFKSKEEEPKRKNSFWQSVKNNPAKTITVISIILLISVYFYKDHVANKQIENIEQLANQQLLDNNNEMLTVLSKPLVWSIRAEMLRGNLEQVNIFVKDIVKEKNFELIQIIDPNNKIILSTDKKLENIEAKTLYDTAILNHNELKIYNTNNEVLLLTTPIMGYDKKLGLLVIKYKPNKFNSISK